MRSSSQDAPFPRGKRPAMPDCFICRPPMYQEHYGFTAMPFNVTPDPRFLYLSPTHQDAMASLRYGVEQKKGFIVLCGEVGCGKTTLCRALLDEMDRETVDTALIMNPRITETELLRAILRELGEEVPGEAPPPPVPVLAGHEGQPHLLHGVSPTGASAVGLLRQLEGLLVDRSANLDLTGRLNAALLKRIAAGKNIVLIIDEAQNLSFEVLEQLRLISNLETDTQKLLQIILIGQPELKAKIRQKELRQLKQRILVFYELKPLSFQQTCTYIQHRLSLAGSRGRPRFSFWALRKIHSKSRGIPRMINNLCDKALLSAFIRDSDLVTYRDASRAVRDTEML